MTAYDRLQRLLEPQSFTSPDLQFGITLEPHKIEQFVEGRTQGYRLYVLAKEPIGMEKEVFIYQRKPILYGVDTFKDDFSHIASAADMEEYQINTPGDPNKPFLRRDAVDLIFRNPDLLVDALVGIHNDVWELVMALDAMTVLDDIGDLRVGKPL
jgi:hypothetical protein